MSKISVKIQNKENLINRLNKQMEESFKYRFVIFDWESSGNSHLLIKEGDNDYILSYTVPLFSSSIFLWPFKKTLFNYKFKVRIIDNEDDTTALGKIRLKNYNIALLLLIILFFLFQTLIPYLFTPTLFVNITWGDASKFLVVLFIIGLLFTREYFLFRKRMEILFETLAK